MLYNNRAEHVTITEKSFRSESETLSSILLPINGCKLDIEDKKAEKYSPL